MRTSFMRPAVALALLAGAAAPCPLAAQLTFAPPAAPANVGGYLHVEECLAASARIRDSVDAWGAHWADTLALVERQKPQASIGHTRDAARRCADAQPRGDADLVDFVQWFELHLYAGRDDRAEALIERRLAAIAPRAVVERAAVLDSAVAIAAGSVRPARLALAERLLDLRDEHDSVVTPRELYFTPFTVMVRAQLAGDYPAAVRAAHRIVRLDERATRATRERANRTGRVQIVFMARTRVTMDSALTALRTRGPEAYVAIRRDTWARASGERPNALAIPIGEAAPELAADVWIGDRRDDAPRPGKGRVALVTWVSPNCGDTCERAYATVRRLAARFPELEVTWLASTDGHVHSRVAPTVADEAALMRETLIAGHRLPGALALEDAKPWYLEAPDGRRIEMPTPNEEAFSFVRGFSKAGNAYIVDRDGTIVEHQDLSNALNNALGEEVFDRIIRILLDRPAAAAGGAR